MDDGLPSHLLSLPDGCLCVTQADIYSFGVVLWVSLMLTR